MNNIMPELVSKRVWQDGEGPKDCKAYLVPAELIQAKIKPVNLTTFVSSLLFCMVNNFLEASLVDHLFNLTTFQIVKNQSPIGSWRYCMPSMECLYLMVCIQS